MKKLIISIFFYTALGLFIGKIVLEKVYEKDSIRQDKYFFIEEISPKDILGITKDYEVAEVIANLYSNTIIVEKYLNSEELKTNIEQFDILVKSAKDKEEILKIEEVVIANYEEIVNST